MRQEYEDPCDQGDGDGAHVLDGVTVGPFPPDKTHRESESKGCRHGDGRALLVEALGQHRVGQRREEGECQDEVRQRTLDHLAHVL